MTDIPVSNKLSAVHQGNLSPLHTLIAARTRLFDSVNQGDTENADSFWSAQWWGLSQSKVFTGFSLDLQNKCLAACNQSILNEAYFIEKSGLAYSAKMVLLSESTDVGQLYALIGADEARHLAWIEPYISAEAKVKPQGQFLAFLSQLIETLSPNLLTYLVQIILEGWGLDHYKRLADGCQYQPLAKAFSAILKDEALHHKSGTMLFEASKLSAAEIELMTEALQTYATMVRVGPGTAIASIQQCAGALSLQQIEELLIALRHSSESGRKLALLKSLMNQKGVEGIVTALEQKGLFTPLTSEEAAANFLNS